MTEDTCLTPLPTPPQQRSQWSIDKAPVQLRETATIKLPKWYILTGMWWTQQPSQRWSHWNPWQRPIRLLWRVFSFFFACQRRSSTNNYILSSRVTFNTVAFQQALQQDCSSSSSRSGKNELTGFQNQTLTRNYCNMTPSSASRRGMRNSWAPLLLGSLVGIAGVDQRREQQELRRLVQQDQIVAPQAVVVHPAAVYLEGCRVVVLLLVEESGALQWVPAELERLSIYLSQFKEQKTFFFPTCNLNVWHQWQFSELFLWAGLPNTQSKSSFSCHFKNQTVIHPCNI